MFTLEEAKFLLHILATMQMGGNRQTIKKTMEIADSCEVKIRADLDAQQSRPEPETKKGKQKK